MAVEYLAVVRLAHPGAVTRNPCRSIRYRAAQAYALERRSRPSRESINERGYLYNYIFHLTSENMCYIALREMARGVGLPYVQARTGDVMTSGKNSVLAFGFLALLAVAMMLSPALKAQQVAGSITGTVTDASGAAVTNATVTVRDVDRGTTWTTQTDDARVYVRIPAKEFRGELGPDHLAFAGQRVSRGLPGLSCQRPNIYKSNQH